MAASFPNGIASFTQKRDNLDVNYASDINRIQDELIAVQQTLGALLTTVNEIEAEVDVLTGEEAALEEELDANERADDLLEKQVTTKFNNLKDRLDWIQQGRWIYAAHAEGGGSQWLQPVTDDFQLTTPRIVRLSKPALHHDPYSMWNGVGFTLKKSGFWLLHGYVRYDTTDKLDLTPAEAANFDHSKDAGTYEASVATNQSDAIKAMDRRMLSDADVQDHFDLWPNVMLTPSRVTWLPKGTRVTLRSKHSAKFKQRIWSASLSVIGLRFQG